MAGTAVMSGPAAKQCVGTRTRESHWVVEGWEPVRRALLLSMPDPRDAAVAVAVLRPYNLEQTSRCCVTLELVLGGVPVPLSPDNVRSAAVLFVAEQHSNRNNSSSSSSSAGLGPQHRAVVLPLPWQVNPGMWRFTPSEYDALGLAAMLWQL